jgi:hypothetical protein
VQPLPDELVGKWHGGPSTVHEFWLELSKDGRYSLTNERFGPTERGTVSVAGSSMTFHDEISDSNTTRKWSLSTLSGLFGYKLNVLYLDGYSYVNDVPPE